ncbi:transporter substrate-binding domain-containing protein [Thalassospiraceae bacterium SW-3-3]|nr:transporter substrate-binding domain-containing protein [Thalassospiraceae bacterium SW-3-3]
METFLPGFVRYLIAFYALILFCGGGRSAFAAELVVAINDAPPYRIVIDTGREPEFSGIYVEVLKEAASRAGHSLRFDVVPFRRALYLMEEGGADIMLGPNRTADREKFMYFFDAPLPDEPKAIYQPALNRDIRQVEELAGQHVGVLRGASYPHALASEDGIQWVEAADYPTLFRMLNQHHLDAVIVPELLAADLLAGKKLAVRKASLVLQGEPSFIALSRKSVFFLDRDYRGLEQELIRMRDDGTFGEIYHRYARPKL